MTHSRSQDKKRGYKSNRKIKDTEEGELIDGMEIAKKMYDELMNILHLANSYLTY